MDIFSQHSVDITKNGIILDQEDITTLEDTNMNAEYKYTEYWKCKGLTLLHKLVLLTNKYPKLNKVIKEYITLYPEEVNKVNEFGWTALHLASYNSRTLSSIKTVKLLLSCSNINAKTNDGQTALMLVLEDLNDGCTALMVALLNSENWSSEGVKVLKLLLSYNADVNAKDNAGYTALMFASEWTSLTSCVKVLKLLLENNADINARNNNGHTALTYASKYCNDFLSMKRFRLLLEYDAIPNDIASKNDINMMKLLNVLS